MKYGVNRNVLLITAGLVWIVAGANVLRIGVVTWMNNDKDWMFKTSEAIIVFLLFFVLVFRKLYYKHTRRIEQDRKSTRLNSSHANISYAVFCLKKNKKAHSCTPV